MSSVIHIENKVNSCHLYRTTAATTVEENAHNIRIRIIIIRTCLFSTLAVKQHWSQILLQMQGIAGYFVWGLMISRVYICREREREKVNCVICIICDSFYLMNMCHMEIHHKHVLHFLAWNKYALIVVLTNVGISCFLCFFAWKPMLGNNKK